MFDKAKELRDTLREIPDGGDENLSELKKQSDSIVQKLSSVLVPTRVVDDTASLNTITNLINEMRLSLKN